MKKHGTVPQTKPLTAKEIFDLGAAIFQQFPRNLDAEKVRADLDNKGDLGRDLGKFFRDRYAVVQPASVQTLVDKASWGKFYRDVFGKEVDLLVLSVSVKPVYDCWPIVIVPGLVTNNEAFDAGKKMFGDAWRYVDDLNTVRDIVERPTRPYVVWVKAIIEADPDLANISADQIAERKLNTLTLLERLMLDLKHFDETKQHLDVENITLCAGSRYADGRVPSVGWHPTRRELNVNTYRSHSADPYLRARAAVVPEA